MTPRRRRILGRQFRSIRYTHFDLLQYSEGGLRSCQGVCARVTASSGEDCVLTFFDGLISIMENESTFTDEELDLERVCAICGSRYALKYFSDRYYGAPYKYRNACAATCLTCWLGCGSASDESTTGNLLREFASTLGPDTHLVVMPVYRLMLSKPVPFQSKSILYPRGIAKLDDLDLVLSDDVSRSLAVFQSESTFIDKRTFSKTPTIAFTYNFDWDDLWHGNRHFQMEFLRFFSQVADRTCLNWIRYRQCEIGIPDALPSRAGQIEENSMISAALLFNAFRRQGRIIAGDAFNSVFTKGLGLPVDEDDLPYENFPDQEGDVGNVVLYALDLYSTILQTEFPTAQFTQFMALLEFLADPTNYTRAPDVAKIIGRYVAKDKVEYEQFKARHEELSGGRDPKTREYTGYRTRVVHMGARLENILPTGQRNELLKELDGYVRAVIDHMIARSSWAWDSYEQARLEMSPFLR
jgi:hypothetical protein